MMKWIYGILVTVLVASTSCSDHDDLNAQLNKEVKAIDAYLANSPDYVAYDGNGARIVVEEFGDDAPPHQGQTVLVHYTAYLFPEGTEFDSGTINDKLESIEIAGLRRGIASILKGTYADLYIPSDYAFGKKGSDNVPPNKTVVYKVHLADVTRTAAEQTQFVSDTSAISSYIKTNKIANVVKLPSGVFYTIASLGSGSYPRPYDIVTFDYKGSLLSNGSVFDEGKWQASSLFNAIDGLKIGMSYVNEGGAATFYIPSGLGYGPNPNSAGMSPNANLVFEVKFNSISK